MLGTQGETLEMMWNCVLPQWSRGMVSLIGMVESGVGLMIEEDLWAVKEGTI